MSSGGISFLGVVAPESADGELRTCDGKDTFEGMLWMALSCRKTKDSFGRSEDRWGSFPCARGGSGVGEGGVVCLVDFHAAFADDGTGSWASFSSSDPGGG